MARGDRIFRYTKGWPLPGVGEECLVHLTLAKARLWKPLFHRASSRPKNHRGRRDTPTSHTGKDHGVQPSSIRNGCPKKTIDYIDTWRHVISEHVGPPRCDIATLGGIRGRAAQIFLRGPQVKETRRVDSQTRPTSPDISHLRKRRNTISKLSENGTRTKQTQGSIFRWIENKSVSTIVPPISRSLSAVIHFHRRHFRHN